MAKNRFLMEVTVQSLTSYINELVVHISIFRIDMSEMSKCCG